MVKLLFMGELNRMLLEQAEVFPPLSQWAQLPSIAAAKQIWWPPVSLAELPLRLSRSESSIKMEKFLIDNTSKENSSEKEDSPSVTSLYSVRPRPSLPPRLFRNLPSRGVEPSRSSWVRLKFTDLWSMQMWLNLCIFLKTATMFTFCLSFATIRVWTSFSKEGRDYTSWK